MAATPPVIELRIERIATLFDPLDPFPIPSRDLSHTAEEFIVGWARELRGAAPLRIVVHVPQAELRSSDAEIVAEGIARHFAGRAQFMQGEQDELFRNGRRALAIGLTVLAICIAASTLATTLLGETAIAQYLSEGVIILGWVANWRPAEIFLYDWWPLARRKRLFQRLSVAPVDVRPV